MCLSVSLSLCLCVMSLSWRRFRFRRNVTVSSNTVSVPCAGRVTWRHAGGKYLKLVLRSRASEEQQVQALRTAGIHTAKEVNMNSECLVMTPAGGAGAAAFGVFW